MLFVLNEKNGGSSIDWDFNREALRQFNDRQRTPQACICKWPLNWHQICSKVFFIKNKIQFEKQKNRILKMWAFMMPTWYSDSKSSLHRIQRASTMRSRSSRLVMIATRSYTMPPNASVPHCSTTWSTNWIFVNINAYSLLITPHE